MTCVAQFKINIWYKLGFVLILLVFVQFVHAEGGGGDADGGDDVTAQAAYFGFSVGSTANAVSVGNIPTHAAAVAGMRAGIAASVDLGVGVESTFSISGNDAVGYSVNVSFSTPGGDPSQTNSSVSSVGCTGTKPDLAVASIVFTTDAGGLHSVSRLSMDSGTTYYPFAVVVNTGCVGTNHNSNYYLNQSPYGEYGSYPVRLQIDFGGNGADHVFQENLVRALAPNDGVKVAFPSFVMTSAAPNYVTAEVDIVSGGCSSGYGCINEEDEANNLLQLPFFPYVYVPKTPFSTAANVTLGSFKIDRYPTSGGGDDFDNTLYSNYNNAPVRDITSFPPFILPSGQQRQYGLTWSGNAIDYSQCYGNAGGTGFTGAVELFTVAPMPGATPVTSYVPPFTSSYLAHSDAYINEPPNPGCITFEIICRSADQLAWVRDSHTLQYGASCAPPPVLPPVEIFPVYECNDTTDNDGDGLNNFPADPGCSSAEDDDERNISSSILIAADCVIPGGSNTCPAILSWSAVGASTIDSLTVTNDITGGVLGGQANGSFYTGSITEIPYGVNTTFTLRNHGGPLASDTAIATCAYGTTYNAGTGYCDAVSSGNKPSIRVDGGTDDKIVRAGEVIDVEWDPNGNTNCVLSGSLSGDANTVDSQTDIEINQYTEFWIKCDESASDPIHVSVIPVTIEI